MTIAWLLNEDLNWAESLVPNLENIPIIEKNLTQKIGPYLWKNETIIENWIQEIPKNELPLIFQNNSNQNLISKKPQIPENPIVFMNPKLTSNLFNYSLWNTLNSRDDVLETNNEFDFPSPKDTLISSFNQNLNNVKHNVSCNNFTDFNLIYT